MHFEIELNQVYVSFAAYGNESSNPSSVIGLRSVNEIRIL